MPGGARGTAEACAALGVYATAVLPRVREERRRWLARAARIPDPDRRDTALAALREKAANVEATGVFATLVARRHRPAVVRSGATLQIAVDYLDSLNEARGGGLEDGLRLHRNLLSAAAGRGERPADHERRPDDPGERPVGPSHARPGREDGGYLGELVDECARATATLPGLAACRPALRAALARCGEGQARTHAAAGGDPLPLREWAEGLDAGASYVWWEVAAGASSSVAAHALLALAAGPAATAADAARVDAAYFPSIGALTVLLDDLVDLDEDVARGEHNYLAYAGGAPAPARRSPGAASSTGDSPGAAAGPGVGDRHLAERLAGLAELARRAVRPLPRRARHEAILAGVAGFYLAQPPAREPRWSMTRGRLLATLGPPARALTAFSRLRGAG